MKYIRAVTGRRALRILGSSIVVGWLGANLLSAYAAANPWVTSLLWQPPDRTGALAAAVPGIPVDDPLVIGHYVTPGARRATMVVVHGYGDDRNSPPVVDATRWLHDAGYGVLAIDLGYLHGRHRYSAGNREAADVSAAIDWLNQRGDTLAGVWGFSAGAHAALIAAARDHRIPRVIADSAFVDGADQIRRTAAATWHIPAWCFALVPPAMNLFSGDQPIDLRTLPWPDTPALIIHGDRDQAVPLTNAYNIRDHTHGELLVIDGAGHTEADRVDPDQYRSRTINFLDDHSPAPPTIQSAEKPSNHLLTPPISSDPTFRSPAPPACSWVTAGWSSRRSPTTFRR